MRRIQGNIVSLVGVAIFALITSQFVQGQTPYPPTPMDDRPIYTYFPDNLVCDEAVAGDGPSIGLVTIGETKLQEIEQIYSDYFEVRIDYFEEARETLIYFHRLDNGAIYRRVDVCVADEVVIVSEREFPSADNLERLYDNSTDEPPNPATFQRVNIETLVRRYGVPDVVTFSTSPNHRVAFWLEQGISAEFYIVFDQLDSEDPPAFGTLSRVIYFPFQDVDGYEERWPFNQTLPEALYIAEVAPFVPTDVPTERNPFDFDSMVATMTAEPSRTPLATATESPG